MGYIIAENLKISNDENSLRTQEDMATAIHVRSIEVLDGDDLSELLVQLANIGLSRYKAPSVWPIPVKYLNECAAREGAVEDGGGDK